MEPQIETVDLSANDSGDEVAVTRKHAQESANDLYLDDDELRFLGILDSEETSGAAQAEKGGVNLDESECTPPQCPICMELVRKRRPHSTFCGHIFCGDCIDQAIKSQKKCPMCNKTLSAKQIFRIYL